MNNNNNIEQRFQSVFDFDELENQDWNVPSDTVWQGVEDELKQKKRRAFFWWWFPVLAISVGGFLYLYKGEQKQQNEAAIIEKNINNNVKSGNENIAKDNEKVIINNTISSESNVYAVEKTNKPATGIFSSKNKSTNKNINQSKSENINFNKKTNNENVFSQNETIVIAPEKEQINNDEQKKATSIFKEKQLEILAFLPNLPFLFLKNKEKEIVLPDYAPINQITKTSKPKHLIIALQANTVGVKRIITNNLPSNIKVDFPNFDGEKSVSAYQVGLNLIKPLKKSNIEFGISLLQLRYQLEYNLALPFNTFGETYSANGEAHSTYQGSVPTSLGNLNMEMVLARQSNQNVLQGEAVPISANGTETLTFINLPISWGKSIALSKKINFVSKVTFNNSFRVASKTDFQSVVSHHSAVRETATLVKDSPTPNLWTPLAGGSVELNYILTPKWTFGLDAFLHQSLKPMFKNDVYSNTPRFFGVGTNLKYAF